MSHASVSGTLCAPPGGRISAVVAGGPVALQIIVNDVLAGDSQTVVVMAPVSSGSTPTPDPFGDDPRSLSRYGAASALALTAGRPPSRQASHTEAGPVVVEVKGGWIC
jgi:hypothetical protein